MDTKGQEDAGTSVGKCLFCSRTRKLTRGLCYTHYKDFRNAKDGLSDEQVEKLENEAIKRGRLLPSEQGKRRRGVEPGTKS